jgi:hypothetical protein
MTFLVDINADDHEDEPPKPKRFKFQIDLAPVDLVPHAIHLFLEQVDHGLMEGTHFYLNGPHIVQAGPQPKYDDELDGTDDTFNTYDASKSADKHLLAKSAVDTINKYENEVNKFNSEYDDDEYDAPNAEAQANEESRKHKFTELGLDQLAFPDYSHDYPHVPWTVGFTGRPGGPDWYINKVDNTQGHGPGGQQQYALNEQGDSCFGTISTEGSGRNALAGYIYQADVYADNTEWHHFIHSPIEIVEARILTKQPLLEEHLHLDPLNSHTVYHNKPRKTERAQAARVEKLAYEAELAAAQQEEGGTARERFAAGFKTKDELPNSDIKLGEGVDPDQLPLEVQEAIAKKKGAFSINKIKNHRSRIPNLDGAAEA